MSVNEGIDLEKWVGETAPLVNPEELETWILHEDERILVLNKPGWLVCHPSKNGPWSSLVGALREARNLDQVHLVARLDRETSGLVILAKDSGMSSILQTAMAKRVVKKHYHAILEGTLPVGIGERHTVDIPLVNDRKSLVHVKCKAQKGQQGSKAISHFTPIEEATGHTLVHVNIETGRKHQIRAHAEWLENRVVGDKIYGPDALWFIKFTETGWTPEMAEALTHPRQALHCSRMTFNLEGQDPLEFSAPFPSDYLGLLSKLGFQTKRPFAEQ
ncbi:MAG: RluA family pseudouridine synthase [Opitutales bacterium]